MEDKQQELGKQEFKGMIFDNCQNLEIDNIPVTFSFKDNRFLLNGKLSVSKSSNQIKYQDELLINVFTSSVVLEQKRMNSTWNRVQIAIPKKEGIEYLKKVIKQLEEQS